MKIAAEEIKRAKVEQEEIITDRKSMRKSKCCLPFPLTFDDDEVGTSEFISAKKYLCQYQFLCLDFRQKEKHF